MIEDVSNRSRVVATKVEQEINCSIEPYIWKRFREIVFVN